MAEDEEAGYPRFSLRGRTFVYLLPCRDEDVLKVGFSRDPLQRMHALHRRYFDYFDLDRALLIEVDKLADARRIERLFIQRYAEQRAPAPLVIRQAAAGQTEWFRGVAAQGDALARDVASSEGWMLHAPLSGWLRQRFDERRDAIYDWASLMLESIEYERFNLPTAVQQGHTELALRHLLDAFVAVDLDIANCVPPDVLAWYRNGGFF